MYGCGGDDPVAPKPPPPPNFSGTFKLTTSVSANTCGFAAPRVDGIYTIAISGSKFTVKGGGEIFIGAWDAANTRGTGETVHQFDVIGLCLTETWVTLDFNYSNANTFTGTIIFWGKVTVCQTSLCSVTWAATGSRTTQFSISPSYYKLVVEKLLGLL